MGPIARLVAPALTVAIALAAGIAAAAPAINIATYKGPDREKVIVEGAKREGRVSIYSGMIENQALRPLVESFASRGEFHLVVRLHYPGMDHETASRAIELFGSKVIPALKGS